MNLKEKKYENLFNQKIIKSYKRKIKKHKMSLILKMKKQQ